LIKNHEKEGENTHYVLATE